jgi:hypothetical protein
MIVLVLWCTLNAQDSARSLPNIKRHEYQKQIAINGLFSIGMTATSGIYWKKGNEAYDHSQKSKTTIDALYYWEQTQNYDRIRNICAIGALLFIGRTIFFYAKFMDAGKQIGALPSLDFKYEQQGTLCFGIIQKFKL